MGNLTVPKNNYKAKFSIPNNYIIQEINGLKGIIRKDKKGDKWLWQPFYKMLVVAKTYGKILVGYIPATDDVNFMRIASHNQSEKMMLRAYDILFGENFLYVLTDRPDNGELSWCLVNPDFKGGTFLGEFEIQDRERTYPFHIPIGQIYSTIKLPDGTIKKLRLTNGEIEEIITHKEPPKPVEKPVLKYNIIVNEERQRLSLIDAETGKQVKESNAIGEIAVYKGIFEAMLGGFNDVDTLRVQKFMEVIKNFEHLGHGIIIPVLFSHIKNYNPHLKNNDILDKMNDELKNNWYDLRNGYSVKIYIQGAIVVAIAKNNESGKILVTPYMISAGDTLFTEDNFKALGTTVEINGADTMQARIINSELIEVQNDSNDWPSPYPVRQQKGASADIKGFRYSEVELHEIEFNVMDKNNEAHGDFFITLAVCKDFTYASKKSTRVKGSSMVKTNTAAIKIV